MKERIKLLRKKLRLSQEEFGSRIKITRSSVSKLENGENNPSDQTVKLICTEFDVNEEWLRTGKGEMKKPTSDELSAFLGDIATGGDDTILEIIRAYMKLDPTSKKAIGKLIDLLVENRKNK